MYQGFESMHTRVTPHKSARWRRLGVAKRFVKRKMVCASQDASATMRPYAVQRMHVVPRVHAQPPHADDPHRRWEAVVDGRDDGSEPEIDRSPEGRLSRSMF